MELLHILITAINAIFPIVLLMVLGYCLHNSGFLSDDFVSTGSKLGFRVLLPTMLFLNTYKIESFSSIPWDVVIYSVLMVAVLFCIGFLTIPFFTQDPKRKGVILQSVFRSNTAVIGVTLAGALGGDGAIAVAAIVTSFSLPLLNILAVVALSIYTGEGDMRSNLKGILKKISRNPLIIGILLGLCCLGIRTAEESLFGYIPFTLKDNVKFLYTAISNVAGIASPLALIVLGGQFQFQAAANMKREIVAGTVWRIIVAPIIALGLAYLLSTYTSLLHCASQDYPALIALFGTPTAVSSAIMAGQMGNDEQLATQLVVWTSVCSIATLFLTICILMSAGLLLI